MNRLMSLRARFGMLAAGAAAVAVIMVAVASWLVVRAKLDRQFDDQLRSYTQLAATAGNPAEALGLIQPADHDDGPGHGELIVQFTSAGGTVATAGAKHGEHIPATPAGQVRNVHIGDEQYRVWAVPGRDGVVQVARDAEGIESTLAELGLLHAAVGFVGVLAAAVLGSSVARTALRPVDDLTAGAERVARTQDLTAKIPLRGRGEIARLAEAFNAMLTALDDSRTSQRRLVEDVSHELRTPLTSLRNNIELLVHAEALNSDLSPADRASLLRDLETQIVELSTLIGELVELGKGETSQEPATRLDLADVAGAAVERTRARTPHVKITTKLASVSLIGRPAALERAVLNLLDNAAKWSPPEKPVHVTLRATGGVARLSVTDHGPGIPPDDLPHVFDRFYRAEAARALPGSGLGLAIVEQIVSSHDGIVRAVNRDGGGTRLEVLLPMRAQTRTTLQHQGER
ncbi:ATP-binding protein [Lentzea sp. NPDC058436]|uniref:HAMP domain-containing sensor histidine kinase n=1 Tax=Lentzea sp. NPDC058436 TaxID=3346499 RepID=UPI0036508233